MNFKKVKMQKLLKLALLYCPTVMVQSKQLLHIGTPKCGAQRNFASQKSLLRAWRLPWRLGAMAPNLEPRRQFWRQIWLLGARFGASRFLPMRIR